MCVCVCVCVCDLVLFRERTDCDRTDAFVETGQFSAAETGQMSAAKARQMLKFR